jgi:cytochrome b subunit of formate dehydrogenase
MFPVMSDLYELLGVFTYNLGLRKTKPLVGSHTYVEKIEYWAVVWGTFIMGLTGFMLWANNYTLRLIPREWLDAATAVHFYEAVLASLAILIWHFYTVIFDPDVYPMDPAWLTGKSVRHRHEHHKAKPALVASEPEAKPEQTSEN